MKSTKHIDFYFVDDDLLYLSFFRKQFKPDISFSLFTFSSGEAFLNKFKRDQANKNMKIVILDYVLNSEDKSARTGLELLPIIKEVDRFAEVIILSGFDNMDVKATGSTIYPIDFIKKNDHTYVRLYSTINTIISSYNLKRKRQDTTIAWYIFGFIATILFSCLILLFIFSSRL